MALQSFVNSIVFAPPKNENNLQRVHLLKHKQHMSFTRKKTGEQIAYYHIAPGGALMTPERLPHVARTSMVILFHHGNAEDLGGCYHYAEWLASSFAAAVVMYDYCGYGFSGTPNSTASAEVNEKTVYSDADHMYGHVLSLGYSASRIILIGRSVGGGPTCYLAEKHHKEVAGVALISTFTSCLRVVSSCCLPYLCCCVDLFPNYRRVEEMLDCPVLIMHGTEDRVVPYHCSCELLATIEGRRTRALKRLQKQRETAARQAGNKTTPNTSTVPASTTTTSTSRDASPRAGGVAVPGEPDSVYDMYLRAYAAVPDAARRVAEQRKVFTPHDVQIGTFHKWFPGCGHNDIENRELRSFAESLMWFVRFATAFSKERGGTRASSGCYSDSGNQRE